MPLSSTLSRRLIRLTLCLIPFGMAGLLLLGVYLPAVAQAPDPAETYAGQTVFTRQDGLPANGVTALWRDGESLWIGTAAGLSRYVIQGRQAGLMWETFTSQDGLAADAVSDLWDDEAGGLWVSHPDNQISYRAPDGVWTTYPGPTQTLEQAYDQIFETQAEGPLWAIEESGRVWTLAEGTVGYYVSTVWRPYGEDAAIPRSPLVTLWDADGVWVAAENGQLGHFDGANWTTYRDVFNAIQSEYETLSTLGPSSTPLWVVDREGAVWVRNAFNRQNPRPDVRRYVEGRWTNFSTNNGMASGFVAELRLDENGRIWARHLADDDGQGGGLSLWTGETWQAIIPAVTGNVTDFWPQGSEGVWIGNRYVPPGGMPIGGLVYVPLNTWERFSLSQLESSVVRATWHDEPGNGDFWLGLDGGLYRYRPARGSNPPGWITTEGLLDESVRDLWSDGEKNLWVATDAGINRLTLQNRKLFSHTLSPVPTSIDGSAAGEVWAAALGPVGDVWAWNGTVWNSHSDGEGLSDSTLNDMVVAADGNVYLATDNALEIWEGEEWRRFAALPGRYVRQVWQDSLGDLWLTTEITAGRPFNLSWRQGGRWEMFLDETQSREMGPRILAFQRDDAGRVWLGVASGLYVYDPNADRRWLGIGAMEGLPPGTVQALYQDRAGTLWVASGNRVYRTDSQDWQRLDPQVGNVSRIGPGPGGSVLIAGDESLALYRGAPPLLRLNGVLNLMTGETQDVSEPVALPLGRNAIRIDLSIIAPTLTEEQLSYQYRLAGYDDGWHHIPARALGGKQASISYAGLPGGAYTFTVAARTQALDYSPPLSFSLYVVSHSPELSLDRAAVAGEVVDPPGSLETYVQQPVQIQLHGTDDQWEPLIYRYRIEGLGSGWTETLSSDISFTLSSAGTFTFMAMALDAEGQSSPPVGAQIVVNERPTQEPSGGLPLQTFAVLLAGLAVLFIGAAIVLIIRRRRRESW
jgi:ligand-binding sensor domain-containing protein